MMKRRSFLRVGAIGLGSVVMPAALAELGCSAPRQTHPEADMAPAPLGVEPKPIAGRGYELVFSDEFDAPLDVGFGSAGRKWNSGMWWQRPPDPSQYSVAGSVLTIGNSNTEAEVSLTTQYHDTSGGTFFQGGYFEALMYCTNWSAFWLYSFGHTKVRATDRDDPATWAGEIDIVETDEGTPNVSITTVHKNSDGRGGIDDQQNRNNNNRTPDGRPVVRAWNCFAALWLPHEIIWYFNDMEICRARAYQSNWHPMFLVLTAQPGGANHGPVSRPVQTKIDWVRVWQHPKRDKIIKIHA